MIFHENCLPWPIRQFLWNIMPYLLFLKKQQNLKLSSDAIYRLTVYLPGLFQWIIWIFGLMGPVYCCFTYQWVQLQAYKSRFQNTIFHDNSAIALHPGTRRNKNCIPKKKIWVRLKKINKCFQATFFEKQKREAGFYFPKNRWGHFFIFYFIKLILCFYNSRI